MAYAILRFAKHKGGASKALSAHHERTKEFYISNPDIDQSRTPQNFHLVTPRWSYEQEIRHRIRMAGCRVRKDSVKFVDTLVTVSPEFAQEHATEMPEYFTRAFTFLKERVGEENIISAVVHLDETTPHMHLCFVPLTKDNRLSAKEILGNVSSKLGFKKDEEKDKNISEHDSIKNKVMEEVKRAFKPEFLNRIDDIIVFDRLTEDNIKEIAKLMLKSLEKRLNANEINVTFTESAVSKIAKSGFDPVYGARPLRRAIQNEIEDMLSEEIIDGNIKSGDSITVDVEDDKFTVKK